MWQIFQRMHAKNRLYIGTVFTEPHTEEENITNLIENSCICPAPMVFPKDIFWPLESGYQCHRFLKGRNLSFRSSRRLYSIGLADARSNNSFLNALYLHISSIYGYFKSDALSNNPTTITKYSSFKQN